MNTYIGASFYHQNYFILVEWTFLTADVLWVLHIKNGHFEQLQTGDGKTSPIRYVHV